MQKWNPTLHPERDRHHADRYPKGDHGAESRAADSGEVGDEACLGDVAEAAVGVGLEEGVVVEAQHLRLDLRDVALQVLLVCGGAAVRSELSIVRGAKSVGWRRTRAPTDPRRECGSESA